ncbi:flavodoxin domain-containing protein [Mangrovibacterium marinum]|uniref:Menaquinone-dependent protoporphyrinogen oxidase n=1 Tax=Mangrovibacterium marinum TaxID=1639118 RepID=A0A2T5C1V7_9BACT|nr:flavodoxin domain-containing protein [Mangrovibacterium marinum]PTN08678.1 menaquinone-dependent protoporphyrinogen oxidase [Mangrovibacterium marinum]
MKTAILYLSTHGCTINVAHRIAVKLGGEVDLINLKNKPRVRLDDYDRIILGGSIHAGKIQKELRSFCERNLDKLTQKELGLYICCMYKGVQAEVQLRNAFPEALHRHAKAEAIMGGAFYFEKMNFVERFLVKKMTGTTKTTVRINQDAIRRFSDKMKQSTISDPDRA